MNKSLRFVILRLEIDSKFFFEKEYKDAQAQARVH